MQRDLFHLAVVIAVALSLTNPNYFLPTGHPIGETRIPGTVALVIAVDSAAALLILSTTELRSCRRCRGHC
jgi:hypothetical protein